MCSVLDPLSSRIYVIFVRVLCVEAGQALLLPKCLFGSQHELILAIECFPMCVCTSRMFPKQWVCDRCLKYGSIPFMDNQHQWVGDLLYCVNLRIM